MSEIVAGFLAPILRQFNYLCCFSGNITSLKNEAEKLYVTERDLQGKVDTARNDVRVICGEVETWLQYSKDIKDEMDGILNEVPNVGTGCLKLGARFSLSKRAKKTTDRLRELQDQCKFDADAISQPRPPAAMVVTAMVMTYEFMSRKKIEEDIMATLRAGDVNMMGIWGMGGVGKTTMAIRIRNRALEEHLFEEIVMVVASQPVDILRIQLEIGGSLGLKLHGETSQARVQKLHARLSGPKRILIILDDVWETLMLVDLGIPLDYQGCRILLTSRNRDVLSSMNVQKIFGMEVLSAEDSWIMFRDRVGTCVDNHELNSIAIEVVNECKGLPIALTTFGAALKNEVSVRIWKDALRQLKQSDPHIPEFISKVYNPLKLSYDALEYKYKSVFLLCCLFPEDADIPLERLTYFCMGLGIFERGIGNVEEARNMMHALIKMLKSRCLLLDSKKGDDHVRIHDVVRDVCIFIAKKEGYIGDDNCTWISSSHRSEIPVELQVPNLRLLFWFQTRNFVEFALDNNFLEGIRNISVICIERYSLVSLPHTTQMLRNLNTLLLDSCQGVETLLDVRELVNLEILICRHCDSIKELPSSIKGLNRLKVLELTGCRNLQRIYPGIISSLVGLEELKMLRSFKKWEAADRQIRWNARLMELGYLANLRCLEIEIEDSTLAVENIRLSSMVDRFTITFLCESPILTNIFDEYLSEKKLYLYWKGATCLGDWILQLLSDTECLVLDGNGANNVDLTKLENIKMLVLSEFESMKNVVTTSVDDGGGANVFPLIDHLYLFKLPRLEEICDGRILLNSFQNLKKLKLSYLPVLKQLWRCSQNDLGKDCLPQLEVLEISFCEMMEQVFSWEREDGNENNSCSHITKMFPKLKELELMHMPNLISFCQGIKGIEFPVLNTIMIEKCGKMKGMVANGMRSSNEDNLRGSSNAGIHLFCSQQVSFGCLKSLTTERNPFCSHTIDHVYLFNGLERLAITKCAGSQSLFKSSMVGNLVNLEILEIEDCDEMEEVIKDDHEEKSSMVGNLVNLEILEIEDCDEMEEVIKDDHEEKGTSGGRQRAPLLFPKLHRISLLGLSKLVSFCELKCDVEFPSLREVLIRNCPNMKNFTLGSLAAPNLESFKTDLKDDLLLQVPFISLKKLSVFWNEKPLNCYHLHGSVFDRLEELTISEYEGSMSLFSSSITGNLVNLTTLTIKFCVKMVKVIEEKEEEKEKVVSGAQRTTILFPKLQQLRLLYLPSLVRFCEWKCDVELPSLTKVEIDKCHNMKSFTLGPLNTPKLESVYISQDFGVVKDLNDILQQQYINRTEKLEFHGESHVVDEATHVADAEFSGEEQGTEPTSTKADRSKHHEQIQVVDEATHVADAEFSSEQQGTKPTSSNAKRSKHHGESQLVDEATPVADAEFFGEQQGTEPTSSKVERSKHHRQIQVVDEATHVADVEFSSEQQGTEPTSSKAERSKYLVEIQVVDEVTPEFSGEHQGTEHISSEAERSKHHREIQVVDEATLVADAEFSGEHQGTEHTLSEAERSKHRREIQVVDEATLVADAEFSGEQQETEPTSSEAERSKHHREIQVVDEATPVADAEFSREQQGTKPTSSKAETSKHYQECSPAPCLFEEKGHYMIGEENNHLQLKLDNEILSISIGDYPSPAPPHNFPVNAMLNFVEQDLRELLERPNSSNLLLLFLQKNKRLTVIHPSFFDSMPDLHFLDISDTKISTLPSSLFKLSKLKVLMLRNCVCLENLPPEIGNLYNMEALDLSGTELYNLPDEIGELTLLRSLQLSLYGPDDESEYDHLPTQLVSPSFLSKLKEIRSLSISVHPQDYRWADIVSGILKDISKLEMLSYLQFYSPEVEAFEDFIRTSPSWKNQEVSKFDFIVGQNVKRVVSRVPDEVESLFNKQERCLRYVNGDKASPLIKTVLNRATAFYLDHHTEVQSLSEFNNSSLQALKFCVVRECPKIKAILDGENAGSEFPCLEHLEIYFLWELEHIWKLPSPTGRLTSGNSAALRSLIISTCPKLQFVFSESMLQSLINLKELVVEDCECMERIIREENEKVKYEDNVLPGLTRLVLHYLPMLVSVGNDVRLSEENISIHGCPKLIRQSQP